MLTRSSRIEGEANAGERSVKQAKLKEPLAEEFVFTPVSSASNLRAHSSARNRSTDGDAVWEGWSELASDDELNLQDYLGSRRQVVSKDLLM